MYRRENQELVFFLSFLKEQSLERVRKEKKKENVYTRGENLST